MRHSAFARSIVRSALCSAWLVGAQATAQVTTSSATPSLSGAADLARFLQQQDQGQQELRKRLADPAQRAQLVAERLPEQRKSYPDLARVLRIDAATEQQLLKLLVETRLVDELIHGRPAGSRGPSGQRGFKTTTNAGPGFDPLRESAREYDRHMLAVGKLLNPAGVDAYLEYQRTRTTRLRVQQIDQTFPESLKLSNAQKDALVLVLADARQRHWEPLPSNSPMLRRATDATDAQPTRGLSRGSRIFNMRSEERMAQRLEAENRELLPRLATILNAAQAQLYTRQREQQVQSLRQRAQQRQRELGVAPNRQLDLPAPIPKALTATTQLDFRLRIDGRAINQTLLSTAGSPVTLEGPEGLFVSATPSLTAEDNLAVELEFYEASGSGRRLLGRETRVIFTANPQPRSAGAGPRAQRSLLRGHKAYLLEWSVVARLR